MATWIKLEINYYHGRKRHAFLIISIRVYIIPLVETKLFNRDTLARLAGRLLLISSSDYGASSCFNYRYVCIFCLTVIYLYLFIYNIKKPETLQIFVGNK